MTKCSVLLAGLFLAVSTVGVQAGDTGLVISDPWIREAPPRAKALAGYMVLKNNSDRERVLLSASSPDYFDVIMLHRTVVEGEIAKMVFQPMITIPPRGEVIFEPNNYHLMLIRPLQPVRAGAKVNITLRFKDGESREVTYTVISPFGN
jgi:copper(I)-binding protein